MIPLITKFKSSSVLYDSLGEITNNYISMFSNKDYIYFLKDTSGNVIEYNTITEEISSKKIESSENIYSILKYGNILYGFAGYDANHLLEILFFM